MPVASVKEFFEQRLPTRFKEKPELSGKVKGAYKFILQGADGGTWTVDLSVPGGKITAADDPAQCTITMTAPDFVDMLNGKLDAQMAFMTGKLKVAGDLGMALKLQTFIS